MKFESVSPTKTWVVGAPLTFNNWVQPRGPTGKRTIIDRFVLHFVDSDVTIGVAAIQGEDAARLFGRVTVEQVDGRLRWNLRGDESRIMAYMLEGPDRFDESADIAVGNNSDVDHTLTIPMAKRFLKRDVDTSIPADVFKAITINCPDQSELDLGSSAVTLASASYYVIAECREEGKIALHAEDIVKSDAFTSTAETQLQVGGRLHNLALFARGASGGASLANLTDVQLDDVHKRKLRRFPDLEKTYARHRMASSALGSTVGAQVYSDPFVNDRACAAVLQHAGARILDAPHIPDAVTIRLTNTVASMLALSHTIVPKSSSIADLTMQRFKLTPNDFRVNTAGKTRRDPRAWGKWAAYMPLSASDKSLG